MEFERLLWYGAAAVTGAVLSYFISHRFNNATKPKLPPGPLGFPIIGNILVVGGRPNESLAKLAKKYGDIMSLRLGFKTMIVVSSPSMARQVLKDNDHILAGRTVPHANKAHSHDLSALVFSQCNSHWRMLRRISSSNLFTAKKLDALQILRRTQIRRLIAHITDKARAKETVNIGQAVFSSGINLLGNMVFGKDMFRNDSNELAEFRETVWELMEVHASPNLADYFPFLAPLDPQGLNRRSEKAFARIYTFLEKLIHERLGEPSHGEGEEPNDLLGTLLQGRNQDLNLKVIRNYLADIFIAGADTVSTTVEWAMAELVKKPEFLVQAQQEMDDVASRERLLQEKDIERLEFLKAIVKETMRLHPPVPLLLPHRADEETTLGGKYRIPKGAEIIVNVWAMGRDPSVWSHDAERFTPERFIDSEVDYKGQHFELIPFGSGRRICVGLPLAAKMVTSLLGSLLHSFQWTLPDSMSPDDVDMSDKFGVTLQKATPSELHATPRLELMMS